MIIISDYIINITNKKVYLLLYLAGNIMSSDGLRLKIDESLKQFLEKLNQKIQDLDAIEVVTAIGDVHYKLDDINPQTEILNTIPTAVTEGVLKLLARTRIELDGDILLVLPGKNDPADQTRKIFDEEQFNKIQSFHNNNIQNALEIWRTYVNAFLKIVEVLGTPDLKTSLSGWSPFPKLR